MWFFESAAGVGTAVVFLFLPYALLEAAFRLIDFRICCSYKLFLLGNFELKTLAPYASSFPWLIEGCLFVVFR